MQSTETLLCVSFECDSLSAETGCKRKERKNSKSRQKTFFDQEPPTPQKFAKPSKSLAGKQASLSAELQVIGVEHVPSPTWSMTSGRAPAALLSHAIDEGLTPAKGVQQDLHLVDPDRTNLRYCWHQIERRISHTTH